MLRMAGVFPMDDEGLGDLAHNGHEIHSDDDCIEVGICQTKIQLNLLQLVKHKYVAHDLKYLNI